MVLRYSAVGKYSKLESNNEIAKEKKKATNPHLQHTNHQNDTDTNPPRGDGEWALMSLLKPSYNLTNMK